jgi:hypothetical protein
MIAASIGLRALAAFGAYLVIALSVRDPLPTAAPLLVLALDLSALTMAIRNPRSTRALRVVSYAGVVLDLGGTAIACRYLQLRHEVVNGNIQTIFGSGLYTRLAELNSVIVAAAAVQIVSGAAYAVVASLALRRPISESASLSPSSTRS